VFVNNDKNLPLINLIPASREKERSFEIWYKLSHLKRFSESSLKIYLRISKNEFGLILTRINQRIAGINPKILIVSFGRLRKY